MISVPLPTATSRRPVIAYLCCGLLCPSILKADDNSPGWETQLYGGEYYSDKRLGAYAIASRSLFSEFSITGEALFERYHNGQGDYDFYGVGGHLLWEVTDFARFGVTGSHSHDSYDYSKEFEDPKSEYPTSAVGLEGELDSEPVTVAVQAGKASSDYYSGNHPYFAMDGYYWGDQYKWYARTAVRRSKQYKEYTLEGYRAVVAGTVPLTLYAGAARTRLSSKEELRTSRTRYDTWYTGTYIQVLTTSSSTWTVWAEAAREDNDSVFSLELNITFGPGVDGPYLSAVDFTP